MDGPRTNPHSLTHTNHDVSLDPPTRSAEHGHHPPQKHAEGGGEEGSRGGDGRCSAYKTRTQEPRILAKGCYVSAKQPCRAGQQSVGIVGGCDSAHGECGRYAGCQSFVLRDSMGIVGRANELDTVKWWSRCDSAHCECGRYAGCKNCTVRDYVEHSERLCGLQ